MGLGNVNGTSQTQDIIISIARGWISDEILGVSDSRMRLLICKEFAFLVGHENAVHGETWWRSATIRRPQNVILSGRVSSVSNETWWRTITMAYLPVTLLL